MNFRDTALGKTSPCWFSL